MKCIISTKDLYTMNVWQILLTKLRMITRTNRIRVYVSLNHHNYNICLIYNNFSKLVLNFRRLVNKSKLYIQIMIQIRKQITCIYYSTCKRINHYVLIIVIILIHILLCVQKFYNVHLLNLTNSNPMTC